MDAGTWHETNIKNGELQVLFVLLGLRCDVDYFYYFWGGGHRPSDASNCYTYNTLFSMKIQKLNGHIVEMYDSVEELPMERFHKFNKLLMIDAGVGSDLSGMIAHIDRIGTYLSKEPALAQAELQNLRQSVYLIMGEISPKHLALIPLIKKIDGKLADDLSDEGLARSLGKLADVSHTKVSEVVEDVKKKLNSELLIYFPGAFSNSDTIEYYTLFRKRLILTLESIIEGESKDLSKINEELNTFQKPEQFSGPNSVEVQADKQYAAMNMLLSQQFHTESKKFTVLEFYTAIDQLRKQTKTK